MANPTATYAGYGTLSNSGSVYTGTAIPIGTAADTRRVIIGLGGNSANGVTLSSATIGGYTATTVIQHYLGDLSKWAAFIWADVPAAGGTTATVSITMSGNVYSTNYCQVWTTTIADLGASPTSAYGEVSASNTANITISETIHGFELAFLGIQFGSSSPSITDFTVDNSGGDNGAFALHYNDISATDAAKVRTLNWTTNATGVYVGLAWAPAVASGSTIPIFMNQYRQRR